MMSSEVESLYLKEENLFFLSSEAVDLDDEAFKFSVPIKGQRLSGVSHCLGWISKDLVFSGGVLDGFLRSCSRWRWEKVFLELP